MDDLLTAIAVLPVQTARERRVPPDAAEQAAFLSAFAASADAPRPNDMADAQTLAETWVSPTALAPPTGPLRMVAFADDVFNAAAKSPDVQVGADQALPLGAQTPPQAPLTGLTRAALSSDAEAGAVPVDQTRVASFEVGTDQALGPRAVPSGAIMADPNIDAALLGKPPSADAAVATAQAPDLLRGAVSAQSARPDLSPAIRAEVDIPKAARESVAAPKAMDAPVAPKLDGSAPAAIPAPAPQPFPRAPAPEDASGAAPQPAPPYGLAERLVVAAGGSGTPDAPHEPPPAIRITQAVDVAEMTMGKSPPPAIAGDRLPPHFPLLSPSPKDHAAQVAEPPLRPLPNDAVSALITTRPAADAVSAVIVTRPAALSQTAEGVAALRFGGLALLSDRAGTVPAAMPPVVSPSASGDGITVSVRPEVPVAGLGSNAAHIAPAPVSSPPPMVGFAIPAAAVPPPSPTAAPPPKVWLAASSAMLLPEGDPAEAALGAASTPSQPAPPGLSDRPMPADIPPQVARQIATAAASMARDPSVPVDIALDPPELGRVRLSLVEVNGAMTLSIIAERPETVELMRRHLVLLADEFARQGLDAPSVNISGGGQGGRDADRHDQSFSQGRLIADRAAPEPMPAPIVRHGADGALDLRL